VSQWSVLKKVRDNSNPLSLANTMPRRRFGLILPLLKTITGLFEFSMCGEQQFWRMMGFEQLHNGI
jgi:hypothetical protein